MRSDYGIGWSLSGLELSGEDEAGVQWFVMDVIGWDDLAGTGGDVHPHTYGDGGWAEPTFLEPPSLVLQHKIIAGTVEEADRAMEVLKNAVPVRSLSPLVKSENGVLKHRMVKQEGKPTFKRLGEVIESSVQLVATDVRILSGDGTTGYTHSDVTSLPTLNGGQMFPAQLPLRLDATLATGAITITNAGKERPPVVVLFTNVSNPSLIADGVRMNFGITVGTGQTLEVDLEARTVKLNGVNRRNALTGPWIEPEDGTQLQFESSTYNPAARMTARWSDAWR